MTDSKSARKVAHPVHRIRLTALTIVVAAIVGGLGYVSVVAFDHSTTRSSLEYAQSVAQGDVPDNATVFDDYLPAVNRLDPDLLDAVRRAATASGIEGVELHVNSGWRSAEYQERLLRDAVSKYGSVTEAERWVSTPTTSEHVSGNAIDIGPPGAAAWLSRHGTAYGLCQIYDNEPWHYELRPGAIDNGCPPRYSDAAADPRTQR